jgi:crossover junction endonuclease MUS81
LNRKRQEIFLKELEKSEIKYEISKLNIGDFTWVARPKRSSFSSTDVVLDYVVERKRIDDLCQSIIDGRYKEQKVSYS